jgi:hypothetical protein
MNDELIELVGGFRWDPLGFAQWAYPWGEPGPLRDAKLRAWQEDTLGIIGEKLRADPHQPIRISRASGHGIGKSALSGILVDWAFNTCPLTRGTVTANTESQLKTKTWVEISKWNRLSLAHELNDLAATALFSKDDVYGREWRIDIVPWSERNTEAFAGLHNQGSRVFLLFDEASAIIDLIWEVAHGALIDEDTEIIWVAMGNPTKNSGYFRESFPDGKFARRWDHRSIDSREVEGTNKEFIQELLEDYGEDSDFFKMRVRGLPPDSDSESFIDRVTAIKATAAPLPHTPSGDMILGVDCARMGDDVSVIYPRRGRDARSIPPLFLAKQDSITLTAMIRDAVFRWEPSVVCIDESNIGAAVLDNLRFMQLPCLLIGVNFGAAPEGFASAEVLNKRAEIYWLLRQWLKDGGCIPDYLPGVKERTFVDELTATGWGFASKVKGRADAIQLESKKDIKKRTGFSPDFTDALACTFAFPMPTIPMIASPVPHQAPDYNPLALDSGPKRPRVHRPGRLIATES